LRLIAGVQPIQRAIECDKAGAAAEDAIEAEAHLDAASTTPARWMAKPPGITLLLGEVIPPLGGNTASPATHAGTACRTGIHSGKGVVAVNAVHKHLGIREDAARADDIETEHPAVCVHSVTGRPGRYMDPGSGCRLDSHLGRRHDHRDAATAVPGPAG
jgi:hypothetical protein